MFNQKERKPKVLFFDSKQYTKDFFNKENVDYGFEFKFSREHLTHDNAALTKDVESICLFVNDIVTPEIADILYNNGVRLIALRSAGYNNINLKAVHGKIHVVRVPAYSPESVAEHSVALMLALNRKIHRAYYRILDNNFTIDGLTGFTMYGKTAGIIGTGKIGQAAIRILRGFGMKVMAYDPFPNPALASSLGFEYASLDSLLKESDVISLYCPLTPETRYVINEAAISKMKDGVMLINTSRGALVDTRALIEGFKSRKIGSAGLDVYEEESDYFFEDHSSTPIEDDVLARLLSFKNVIVTSHQAIFTKEALEDIARTTMKNIASFYAEEPLVNEICYKCERPSCQKKANGRCF